MVYKVLNGVIDGIRIERDKACPFCKRGLTDVSARCILKTYHKQRDYNGMRG